jgi:hypothetical protein
MIRPADVYLDYCDQVPILDEEDLELEDEAGLVACEGCPVGGGLDCPGTWRWRATDRIVTQAEREARAIDV